MNCEVFVPWAMAMLNDQWPLMLGDPLRPESNLFVRYTSLPSPFRCWSDFVQPELVSLVSVFSCK